MRARRDRRVKARAGIPPARAPWRSAVVLAIAICAVYANSLSGPFVLDDAMAIVGNPTIRNLADPGRVILERVRHSRGQ